MSLDLTNAFVDCNICPWGHLCMNFWVLCVQQPILPVLIQQFAVIIACFLPKHILQLCCYCFTLALFIIGSYIVFNSMLSRLRRFLWPSICADSLRLQIFQWCSLSMISTWSHRGRWPRFCLHMWSATPDFSTSLRVIAFWCFWSLTLRVRPVSPLYFLPQLHGIAYTQSLVMFSTMGGSYSGEISPDDKQCFMRPASKNKILPRYYLHWRKIKL